MSTGKRSPSRRKIPAIADLRPVGIIRSTLKSLEKAPMQGTEGAPDAWLEVQGSRERLSMAFNQVTRSSS
jgi:hypothetical protein